MRPLFLVFALAGTLASSLSAAAPSWQNISTDAGRRIELDRTTLKRTGNVVEILSRVTLERELLDAQTGTPYRIIEATTRYDCATRNAKTIRRVYRQSDKETLREEMVPGVELPVRGGTLDDRVLREVCRPPKGDPLALAKAANEAAGDLQAANAAMIKNAVAADQQAVTKKVADTPEASIRPNLKAQVGASSAPLPISPPSQPASAGSLPVVKAPAGATQYAQRSSGQTRGGKAATRPANSAGYMLEVLPASVSALSGRVAWGYEGAGAPANWAQLDARNVVCASGKRQSPIDIRDGIKVDLEPIRFDYRPSTFRIVDNGHTISVNVGDSRFSLTGKTYELDDIHFHRPAEMLINGQRHEMSIHLVHRSLEGAVAVVALLLERGAEHPEIQTLWNYLPLEKNTPVQPPKVVINPGRLLPESAQYYTFMGSLTTPPCTEGVTWIVMKQPVQVSDEQIRIFSRLYRNNARPVQAANERLIKESR